MDFKGPLPSSSKNRYILTIIDEYSRFPFAFAGPILEASTVIKCLEQLFAIFGMPNYIHSDRGQSFMTKELNDHLHNLGIATEALHSIRSLLSPRLILPHMRECSPIKDDPPLELLFPLGCLTLERSS